MEVNRAHRPAGLTQIKAFAIALLHASTVLRHYGTTILQLPRIAAWHTGVFRLLASRRRPAAGHGGGSPAREEHHRWAFQGTAGR
jgi:hypothetical protein